MDDLLIFISYAQEDVQYKDAFIKEFSPAAQNNKWRVWQDGEIKAGAFWDNEIKNNLEQAEVIALLVSSDFLNSDYINNVELMHALEKQKQGAALVIPIILDDCLWEEHDMLPKIQAIRVNDKIKDKGNKDEIKAALQYAARQVRDSVKAYKPGKTTASTIASAALKREEINELRKLDLDAFIILVRNNQQLYFLPPNNADIGQPYPISEQWLPPRAFAIIQRLVAEEVLEENEYEALGEAFFYRLFPQKQAQEAFKELFQKHAANRKEDNPLKIILHFDLASADLASLPWEYLWLPFPENEQPGFFVGSKAELVLTRRLSAVGEKGAPQPLIDKIRVLVAYSKPHAPAELAAAIEENAQKIEEQCQALPNIEIKRHEIISEAKFKEFIAQNGPFEVVHFIGKSRTEKKDAPDEIALFDPAAKKPEWLSPERFVQCFEEKNVQTKKPNLLFFNVVRDNTDFCGSLSKTARQLIDKVDGIMSIQTNVAPEQSAVFAKELYAALGQGKDLDVAVAAAARQLAKQSRRLYGISAAYSRRTLKMHLGKPLAMLPDDVVLNYLACPNWDKPGIECKEKIGLKGGGRPTRLFCDNEKCNAGPLWQCPNCNNLIILSKKLCPRCGYEIAKIQLPDDVRHLLPAQPGEMLHAPKPATPGNATDRAAHSPQESRRAEPGLPKV
jgi:hypothetical protein